MIKPVVVGTDGLWVLFVTVTARGVDGAAGVGQLVWRVGDTHLGSGLSISIPGVGGFHPVILLVIFATFLPFFPYWGN